VFISPSQMVASSKPVEMNGFFFSIYLILLAALGPVVYSASNRNEYQKHKNNNVTGIALLFNLLVLQFKMANIESAQFLLKYRFNILIFNLIFSKWRLLFYGLILKMATVIR
jgi:hypothetical protein